MIQDPWHQGGRGKQPRDLLCLVPLAAERVHEEVTFLEWFCCVEADEAVYLSRQPGSKQVPCWLSQLAPELLSIVGTQMPLGESQTRTTEGVGLEVVPPWQVVGHDVDIS